MTVSGGYWYDAVKGLLSLRHGASTYGDYADHASFQRALMNCDFTQAQALECCLSSGCMTYTGHILSLVMILVGKARAVLSADLMRQGNDSRLYALGRLLEVRPCSSDMGSKGEIEPGSYSLLAIARIGPFVFHSSNKISVEVGTAEWRLPYI